MLSTIITTWSELVTALTGYFSTVSGIFYDSTTSSLTFVGTLAVIMAGISIVLLIFNLIRSFMPMRG